MMKPFPPIPSRTQVVDPNGLMSGPWVVWFQNLYQRLGYALGLASTEMPLMDGIVDKGNEGKFSDGLHRHPTDTSRAADSAVVHNTGNETVAGVKTFTSPVGASLGVQFGTAVEPTPLVQGLTFWDESDNTLTTAIDPVNGVVLQHGQEIQIRVVNKTGSTIPNGTAVYRNGVQGNRPTVAPAIATSEGASQVIGLATQDIADNAEGYITNFGIVRGIDTRGYTAGNSIYLSAVTPGAYSNTSPSSPNFNTYIGVPLNSTVNGSIFVRMRPSIALDTTLSDGSAVDTASPSQKAVYQFWVTKDATYLHTTGDETSTGIKTFQEVRSGLTRLGGASNYTSFEADGTMVAVGNATTYNGVQFSVTGAKVPAANAPTWASFVGNLNEYTFAINDYIDLGAQELRHDYLEGSNLEIHVHWATNSLDATDRAVKWEIEYTVANMASSAPFTVFPATTTVSSETVIPANTAAKSHIYSSIGVITGTGLKIGAQVKFRLKRITASTTAPSGNPFALQVGLHYQQDTMGSRTTTSK